VRVIGERGEKFMKQRNKIKYSDEPIGKVKILHDFLPSPENLIMKEDTEKVTLFLTKASIDFFKKMAKNNHTQYQKMIRQLLNQYAMLYQEHYK
jgi:hypothetical protein